MKLLDEIIEMAADGKNPISDALRKCLILAFQLKNETLKEWVEHELNGYEEKDAIPDYRKVVLYSRGNFTGPGGAWLPKRALPISIIAKEHRKWLVTVRDHPESRHYTASTEIYRALVPSFPCKNSN
jgi:AbiTii